MAETSKEIIEGNTLLPDKEVKEGAESLIESAHEACMLIVGAYEGYSWEGGDLKETASRMFEYAKAGYAIKPKEDKPERLFTLDEMKKCAKDWFDYGRQSMIIPIDAQESFYTYFKETFGIDI